MSLWSETMNPTKDDYNKLADMLGVSLDHCNEASLYGDDLFTAYKALRLASNMPSEEEIIDIIASNSDGNDPMTVLTKQARAILKRLGVEG